MKKTLVLLLALLLAVTSLFTGCGKKEGGNGERMTITVGYPNADETWKNDDYYKYIADKFNVDFEFQTLSSATAAEKARLWISSGDMPDILQTGFSMNDYLTYTEQGMIGSLPKDWAEKYPNVGFAMEMSGLMNVIREKNDGEVSVLIRATDAYADHIDDFRAAYSEGKDLRAMMSENQYRAIDGYGFAYRKDWAEQLGIETSPIMEYEDFLEMARKFKEADLGKVGSKNTVGIAIDYTEAPNFFVTAFNSSYKYFHKDESGKYVCGLLEDSTAEGVKEYTEAYRTGILARDFYTQKSDDLNSLFCSQRSGIIFPRASTYYLRILNSDFEKANPGKKAEDCIDVCWVLSPDGKIHGREQTNYYGAYYFSPDISDEKMAKILEIANYVSSPEGGPQVRLGVPGVDYKEENGEYIVLRQPNENGVLETLDKKYPSYEFFRYLLNPFYDQAVDSDPYAKECNDKLEAAKREYDMSLLDMDEYRSFYTADDYVKFNAAYEVNGLFAEVVVADGDPVENWKKKRAEIEKAAKSVTDNMNAALLKK